MSFHTKYPTTTFIVDLEAQYVNPPIAQLFEARPHTETDEFREPPLYPPCSAFPKSRFRRIDNDFPPFECYFTTRRTYANSYSLRPEFATPTTALRSELRMFIRHSDYVLDDTFQTLRSSVDNEETYSGDDMCAALLECSNLTATVTSAYRKSLLADSSFNRWKAMMCECYTKVDMGLTILATSVADEYDGEWRLFDDRVIVWLVQLLLETLIPTCVNLESCISRWYENVTLWSARNYVEPTLYFGVLSRTPRAHVTYQPHVQFESAESTSETPTARSTRSSSRTAIRSRSQRPSMTARKSYYEKRTKPISTSVTSPSEADLSRFDFLSENANVETAEVQDESVSSNAQRDVSQDVSGRSSRPRRPRSPPFR